MSLGSGIDGLACNGLAGDVERRHVEASVLCLCADQCGRHVRRPNDLLGRERIPHLHHTERPGADRNGTRDD
jgi:hypothetical protein